MDYRAGVITAFRIAAIVEAITWAGLLVSMYFKYIEHRHTGGLHIFGSLHGYASGAFVLVALLVRKEYNWSNRITIFALLSSVPPFASVIFERWAFRQRRLTTPIPRT